MSKVAKFAQESRNMVTGERAETKTRSRSRVVEFRTAELSYANFGQLYFNAIPFSDKTEKRLEIETFHNLSGLGYFVRILIRFRLKRVMGSCQRARLGKT